MLRLIKPFHDRLLTYGLLTLLALMIILWTLLALVLLPWLPRKQRRQATRTSMSAGFRMFSWALKASGAYKLDLRAIDALRTGPPLILAPNHPTLIDAILILTRHPNIACVMKPELMSNFFLGAGARLADFIRSDPPRRMIREAVEELQRGSVVLLFPEGTRTRVSPTNPLTASVAVIAKHAHVPVQVAIIETDSPYMSKGWSLLRPARLPITYRVRLGRRFDPPSNAAALTAELQQEFASELRRSAQSVWLEQKETCGSAIS
jgi:1-acyl-sn-glycerol-3-phosphate acyltransferase